MTANRRLSASLLTLLLWLPCLAIAAPEGIEFVAEHMPEALLDNRIASLPIWDWQETRAGDWQFRAAPGYSRTTAGSLVLAGPLASLAVRRAMNRNWSWSAVAFVDRAEFRSGAETRALRPRFAMGIPLDLPADASITDLSGTARDAGAAVVLTHAAASGRFGPHRLLAGVMWQRLQLRGYALSYRIVSGASAGVVGSLDYSATYSFLVPHVAMEWNRTYRSWSVSPHILAALPLPAQPLLGRISGPGFSISGTTAEVGRGKHVGEPYLGFGLVLNYRPLGISVDLGSTLSQAFIERLTHRGIEQNLVLSVACQF